MRKLLTLLLALVLVLGMAGCGVSASSGTAPTEKPTQVTEPTQTPTEKPTEATKPKLTLVPVDFTDFIRLTGVSYQGDWRKTQVSLDRIGQKLGEVSCRIVGLYSDGRGEPGGEYYADSEGNLYDKLPNGASACNNVGTELFAVKDNENAIAALVDGKYYLYTASQ